MIERGRDKWVMLGLGVGAQSTSSLLVHGTPFLIPALMSEGMSLPRAGMIVALPSIGVLLTLIAWGVIVDRIGERSSLAIGLTLTSASSLGAALTTQPFWLGAALLFGGMAAASTNSASGRVVAGWFPAHRRGLTMGIRQMAQPLGVGIGAIAIPVIAQEHSISTALVVPGVSAALFAGLCAMLVVDPPRPTRDQARESGLLDNPYRKDASLVRIHLVSVLLCVPQTALWTFALVWLTAVEHWDVGTAGVVVMSTQVLGALGRIGAGLWSDRIGSRMRPIRTIAIVVAITMTVLAIASSFVWIAIPALFIAAVFTVADNGLAFTSIAETTGPYWSGKALGVQNTSQYVAVSAVPPAFGAIINSHGYPAMWLLSAAIAIAAIPLVPVSAPGDRTTH